MKYALPAMLASLLVAGCAATTPPDVTYALAPADPVIDSEKGHYHPVVTGYVHRDPVDPKNWRRLNDDLSPAKTGGAS